MDSRSNLLVEELGVPGENDRSVAPYWQTFTLHQVHHNEPGVPGENHKHVARHRQPFTLYRVHHLSMTRRTWRTPQTCSRSLTNLYVVSSTPPPNESDARGENHEHVLRHWQTFTLYRVHHLSMNPMHVEKTMNMYYAIDKLLRCIEYTTSQWSRCIWRKSQTYIIDKHLRCIKCNRDLAMNSMEKVNKYEILIKINSQ